MLKLAPNPRELIFELNTLTTMKNHLKTFSLALYILLALGYNANSQALQKPSRIYEGVDYDFSEVYPKWDEFDWGLQEFRLFPDSIRTVLYNPDFTDDTAVANTWCSVGFVFDPKEEAFELADPTPQIPDPGIRVLEKDDRFSLDSVKIFYLYDRKVDKHLVSGKLQEVDDRVELGIFKVRSMVGTFSEGLENPYATVKYNRQTGRPGTTQYPAEQTVSVPLRIKDTATTRVFTSKTIDLRAYNINGGVGISHTRDELLAFTATYLPGQQTDPDDTLVVAPDLIEDGLADPPKKVINTFSYAVLRDWLNWREAGSPYRLPRSFCGGMVLPISERHQEDFWESAQDALKSSYIPGRYYYNIIYPMFEVFLSVEKAVHTSSNGYHQNGIDVGHAYPNPARVGDLVKLPIALTKASKVRLDLYSPNGKLVMSQPSMNMGVGQHELLLPLDAIDPGLYLFRLQIGDEQHKGHLRIR